MSQKSVAEKLGVKKGQRVLILAPAGYSPGTLPPDARLITKRDGKAYLVQVFVSSMDELKQTPPSLKAALNPNTPLWVSYPKGTSKIKTDVNRDIIREYASTVGFEAAALFAVDQTWCALRLKNVEGRSKGAK